ncbi:MAG: hypothetical protein F6K36_26490 [Symploca sp. SIO3C6]|nr:hypothetical protein [Symploca sp. SIO3C6]
MTIGEALMPKVALLVGVSEYQPGLQALPSAAQDVVAMQQVLEHPEMGGFDEVKILTNPLTKELEIAIYDLFAERHSEDVVLFYFSGHGVKDEHRNLYLTTSETRKNSKGIVVTPTAVAANYLQTQMSRSLCQRQVLILDCCYSGAMAKGLTAKDEGEIDILAELGGKGRAILTSSTSVQSSFQQDQGLSIYTQYLVEGIETGAADRDGDGRISADELHQYASGKILEASPAMTPQFYPLEGGYRIYLARAPQDDPKLEYRKAVEEVVSEDREDIDFIEGEIDFVNRCYLDELQTSLGLSSQEAQAIETEVMEPYRLRFQKLQRYQEVFKKAWQKQNSLSDRERRKFRRFQQVLRLRDEDVSAIEVQIAPQAKLAPPQPISRDEALSRIEFVRENLLDLKVDAIVIPTSPSLSFDGHIGRQILERLGSELYKKLRKQPRPSLGEVLVTYASPLPACYLFYTPTRKNFRATATTVFQSVTAALTQAESINDVRTIAFPSIGTGVSRLNPVSLAPEILRIVASHLERGSQLEKVIFAFVQESAYQAYISAYQSLLLKASVTYGISLAISPQTTSIGREIKVSIHLKQIEVNKEEDHILQIPHSEAIGGELNILLNAPGFRFNSDNATSLPLNTDADGEVSTQHLTQTANFSLTALRPGSTKIKAELYCGKTFNRSIETEVQVTPLDETKLHPLIAARSRPVPQPNLILQVQTAWNDDTSACTFRYHLDSFHPQLLFADDVDYNSKSLSTDWVEYSRLHLKTHIPHPQLSHGLRVLKASAKSRQLLSKNT